MLEFFNSFFAGFSAQQIIMGAIGVLVAYFPSIRILGFVKEETGWEDDVMHRAVVGFFMLLALVTMILTGELDPNGIEWTLETLLAYWGTFSVIGETAYQRLKAQRKEEASE